MSASPASPRELLPKTTSQTSALQQAAKSLTPHLPPIASRVVTGKPPRAPPPSPEPWSYYHRHCQHPKYQTQPWRRRYNPNKKSKIHYRYYEDQERIRTFLDGNREFLENYVAEEIPASELEWWLTIKRQLDGTSPKSLPVDFNDSNEETASTTNEVTANTSNEVASRSSSKGQANSSKASPPRFIVFQLCRRYAPREVSDSSDQECVPSPPIVLKHNSIVQVEGQNICIHIVKEDTHQRKSARRPKLRKEKAIDLPDSPSPVKTVVVEFPSSSLESPKVQPKAIEGPVARDNPTVPPKAKSANGGGKTRRLLPELVNGSERRRACTTSGSIPSLHLAKPVMKEYMKNITVMIQDLVTKIIPDTAIEIYRVDQEGVYSLLRDSLELKSIPHEKIIRQVVAEGRPTFLNRRDLLRLSSPPKQLLQRFNEQIDMVLIPLKVNFGTIVVEVLGAAFDTQVMVLLQNLQQIFDITLPYYQENQSLLQESKMSAFLLQVAQAVFEEMLSLDQLIKKILEVAQRLVSADRASLFLVDHRNLELVSTVFDLRYEANQDSDLSKKEIRIPINKGIAGHVAMSGETMNIPDAYLDERFNKAVDEATGYHTVSILCMPIKVRGKVLAVVQMVNKRDKKIFGPDDESAFQVFSTFFGLALHHAKLYDKIKRKEQKYKVALEVLGYHNTCCEEDVENILKERPKAENINYNDFALDPFEVDEIEKCKSILNMFEDLFDMTRFDIRVLARFVLTVKKNYRKVPYHNFDHGWAVANSMYVMLKNDPDSRFDFNNRLALFVACLCHDLDHRGYTNKFMSEIASPLAAIYTTSTLEHHHFNMTVTILQQDGHNIFYRMSGEEYKDILDSIRQCILATDLAAFFPNLKKINELVFETPQFDWEDASHRALGRSFCMTSADLSASAKPFGTQLQTVAIIVAEFYQQGDLERQAGRSPIPMMDRRCQDQVPACQVGFLSQICLPCYRVLAVLFPSTLPMLEMATANLETWKAKAEEIERKNDGNEQTHD